MQNFGSSFKFLIVLELRTEGLIYLFCIWLFLTHLWSIFPFLQPLKSPKNLWSEMDKCCCLLDYHRFKTFLAILLIRKTHWKLCMKYWGISSHFSSIYKRSQEISTQHCKHSIKDFFSKYDQLQFLRIWSHLRKKTIMNIFCIAQIFVAGERIYLNLGNIR